jgi:hypothetical protein
MDTGPPLSGTPHRQTEGCSFKVLTRQNGPLGMEAPQVKKGSLHDAALIAGPSRTYEKGLAKHPPHGGCAAAGGGPNQRAARRQRKTKSGKNARICASEPHGRQREARALRVISV